MPIFISPSNPAPKPAPTRWEEDSERLRRVTVAFIDNIDESRLYGLHHSKDNLKEQDFQDLRYLFSAKGALLEAFKEAAEILFKLHSLDEGRSNRPADTGEPEPVTEADIALLRDYLQRQD